MGIVFFIKNPFDSMNTSKYLNEWVEKEVFCSADKTYVTKFFKEWRQILPYNEQLQVLETKKKYLWKHMPETFLEKIDSWDKDYCIKQKYISWEQIRDIDFSDLSELALKNLWSLLESYISYCNKEGKYIDAFGYQKQYKDLSSWQRRTKLLLKIYKNFLISSNIIITDDDQVYYIDIAESFPFPDYYKFKNFLMKPFIYFTLKKVKKSSSKETQIWEKVKKDLHQALK